MSAKITLKHIKDFLKKVSFKTKFIKPVIKDTIITEQNTAAGLKEVHVLNIPHSGNDYDPIAWLVDLEMKHPIFGIPASSKPCEQALVLMANRAINVYLFELKSSLDNKGNSGLAYIQEKITDSSARVAYLLPLYISDNAFDGVPVNFWGIVCYNHDKIEEISEEQEERKTEIYKILKEKVQSKGRLYIEDSPLLEEHRIEILFFQNPNPNTSSMTINFQDFYTKRIGNTDLRCLH
ncbi:MAG: hypothetical protein ACPGVB_05940 [Chitinophagales bacterium]